MEPNLSLKDAIFRYVLMGAVVITGGLMHNVWVMAMGVPIFLSGMLGYCAIYHALGIDHSKEEQPC